MLKLNKTISIAVAICFTATNLGVSAFDPGPQVSVAPSIPGNEAIQVVTPIDTQHFEIPTELGRVESVRLSEQKAAPVLIHIKDAHGSYEAQVHIQKLIEQLTKQYGIKTIFLEGGAGKLNPNLLRFFKNDDFNFQIADMLAEGGEIGGGELFLLKQENSQEPVEGYGVENIKTYAKNFRTFRFVMERADDSERFIRNLRAKIESKGSRVLNRDLLSFLRAWQTWKEDHMGIAEFLNVIQKFAKTALAIDLTHPKSQITYPMLVRLYKAKELEAKLNLKRAEEEKVKLLEFLKSQGADESFLGPIQSWDFSKALKGWTAKKSPRVFLEDLYQEFHKTGFELKDYSELVRCWAWIAFQSEIDGLQFFDETESINQEIFKALAKTDAEKEVVKLVHDSILLEKLLTLKLTRQEASEVRSHQNEFTPAAFLKHLSTHGKQPQVLKSTLNQITQTFDWAIQFYGEAETRENYMAGNIDELLKQQTGKAAILVTGGYHTDGLKEAFINKKFSYIEVSPHLTSMDGAEKTYLEAMLGTRRTIFDLSHISNLLATVSMAVRAEILQTSGVETDPLIRYVLHDVLSFLESKKDPITFPELISEFNESAFADLHGIKTVNAIDRDKKPWIQVRAGDKLMISIPMGKGILNLTGALAGKNSERGQNTKGLLSSLGAERLASQNELSKLEAVSRSEARGITPLAAKDSVTPQVSQKNSSNNIDNQKKNPKLIDFIRQMSMGELIELIAWSTILILSDGFLLRAIADFNFEQAIPTNFSYWTFENLGSLGIINLTYLALILAFRPFVKAIITIWKEERSDAKLMAANRSGTDGTSTHRSEVRASTNLPSNVDRAAIPQPFYLTPVVIRQALEELVGRTIDFDSDHPDFEIYQQERIGSFAVSTDKQNQSSRFQSAIRALPGYLEGRYPGIYSYQLTPFDRSEPYFVRLDISVKPKSKFRSEVRSSNNRREFMATVSKILSGIAISPIFSTVLLAEENFRTVSATDQAKATANGMLGLIEKQTGLAVDKARIDSRGNVVQIRNDIDFTKTSPSNIGLEIVSLVVSREQGWISKEDAMTKLIRVISTLEKMERYQGFWYNWYDLENLDRNGAPRIVLNQFISSVDNANLAASLMVLREVADGTVLAERIQKLLDAQDWSFFYDERSGFMNHGYDTAKRSQSEFGYGTFNTEARLLSFISVLHGVNQKAWDGMDREVLADESGKILVVASWGGSLFESLFPDIFMNAPGAIAENNRNMVTIHQNKANKLGYKIFGWSPALNSNNIYSEAGVPEIGARGGGKGYPVGAVSPYSMLLAARYADPKVIGQNLSYMRTLNPTVYGSKFGYRDAIDPKTGKVTSDILSLDKGIEVAGFDVLFQTARKQPGTVEKYFWQYLEKKKLANRGKVLLNDETGKFLEAKKRYQETGTQSKSEVGEPRFKAAQKDVASMKSFIKAYLAEQGYEVAQDGWLSGFAPFYSAPENGNRPFGDFQRELSSQKLEELKRGGLLKNSRSEVRADDSKEKLAALGKAMDEIDRMQKRLSIQLNMRKYRKSGSYFRAWLELIKKENPRLWVEWNELYQNEKLDTAIEGDKITAPYTGLFLAMIRQRITTASLIWEHFQNKEDYFRDAEFMQALEEALLLTIHFSGKVSEKNRLTMEEMVDSVTSSLFQIRFLLKTSRDYFNGNQTGRTEVRTSKQQLIELLETLRAKSDQSRVRENSQMSERDDWLGKELESVKVLIQNDKLGEAAQELLVIEYGVATKTLTLHPKREVTLRKLRREIEIAGIPRHLERRLKDLNKKAKVLHREKLAFEQLLARGIAIADMPGSLRTIFLSLVNAQSGHDIESDLKELRRFLKPEIDIKDVLSVLEELSRASRDLATSVGSFDKFLKDRYGVTQKQMIRTMSSAQPFQRYEYQYPEAEWQKAVEKNELGPLLESLLRIDYQPDLEKNYNIYPTSPFRTNAILVNRLAILASSSSDIQEKDARRSELREAEIRQAIVVAFEDIAPLDWSGEAVEKAVEDAALRLATPTPQPISIFPIATPMGELVSAQFSFLGRFLPAVSSNKSSIKTASGISVKVKPEIPTVTLKGDSELARLLLVILSDKSNEAFINQLNGQIEIFISSEGKFKAELEEIKRSYGDGAKGAAFQWIHASPEPFYAVAESHKNSAIFIENATDLNTLNSLKDLLIALAELGPLNQGEREMIAQIIIPFFVGVGNIANALQNVKGETERAALIAKLNELSDLGILYQNGILNVSFAQLITFYHRAEARIQASA